MCAQESDTIQLSELEVKSVAGMTGINPSGSAVQLDRLTIEQDRLTGTKTMSAMIPNFFIPDYGSRMTSTIYVRGLGARIDQPAVGLSIDNIPILCKENYDLDVPDMRHVEVLLGPQSTLYGRNTMGGQVNIYTLSPLAYQGTRALVEAGSHGSWRAGVSHYARLRHNVGLSGTVYYTTTAGSHINEYNCRRCDWEHQFDARAKLQWQTPHGWQLSNVLQASVTRQGGYPYLWTETGKIAYNDTCFYRRTSIIDGLTLQRQWHWGTLSSVTSYQYLDDNMTLDQDFTPLPYFTLTQARREHAATQEVLLRGCSAADRYTWSSGAFGFYRRYRMSAPVTFLDTSIDQLIERHRNSAVPRYPIVWDSREFLLGSDFTCPTWGAALYHQSRWQQGRWAFTAGLRLDYEHTALDYHSQTSTGYTIVEQSTSQVYSHERIDIDDSGHLSKHFVQLLPRLTVSFNLGGGNDIYGQMSKGYKAGGYNTQMFSDVLQQRLMGVMGIGASYDTDRIVGYDPEIAWNYEVGGHIECFSGRLKGDVSAFYIDCRDRQLTVFPDGTTTGRVMTNAGRTSSWGVEASFSATPLQAMTVQGSYGFTSCTFDEYNDGKADYAGKTVPYVPANTLYGRMAYRFNDIAPDLSLTASTDVRGAGRIWWNEANSLEQPFYVLWGVQVECQWRRATLRLWGENLTDTDYATFYFVSIGHEFLQRGQGRKFGVTLQIDI